MEANTPYNDLVGTASASISDPIGFSASDDLDGIAKFFGINQNRFKPIALSIHGTEGFGYRIICVDLDRSTDSKEFIVDISLNTPSENILDALFKSFHIMLFNKFDKEDRYKNVDEQANYSDFH